MIPAVGPWTRTFPSREGCGRRALYINKYAIVYRAGSAAASGGQPGGTPAGASPESADSLESARQPAYHHEVHRRVAGGASRRVEGCPLDAPGAAGGPDPHPQAGLLPQSAFAAGIDLRG